MKNYGNFGTEEETLQFRKDFKEHKGKLSVKQWAEKLGTPYTTLTNVIYGGNRISPVALKRFYKIINPVEIKEPEKPVKLEPLTEKCAIPFELATDCLMKENQKVYNDLYPLYYKIENGFLCSFSQKTDKLICINVQLLESDCMLYVIQKKKFNLELGHTYLTENEDKFIVVSIEDEITKVIKLGTSEIVKTDKNGSNLNIVKEL